MLEYSIHEFTEESPHVEEEIFYSIHVCKTSCFTLECNNTSPALLTLKYDSLI